MKTFSTIFLLTLSTMCFAQSGGIENNTGVTGNQRTTGVQALDQRAMLSTILQNNYLVVSTTSQSGFKGQLSLYDMNGSLVKSVKSYSNTIQIDVNGLSTGIYLLEAPVENETVIRKVFITH
ncbi:MAG: T9SS type A sorting domain-containing protein [Flavobacteriales bacterium]